MFKLMTFSLWKFKLEKNLDIIKNKTCQQSLKMRKSIEVGEATSKGFQQE